MAASGKKRDKTIGSSDHKVARIREVKVKGPSILPPEAHSPISSQFVTTYVHEKKFMDGEVSCVMSFTGFLTPDEADVWIQFGESEGFALAKHAQTSGIALRDCGRLVLENQGIADAIFSRLRSLTPPSIVTTDKKQWDAVTCSSNLRLYKYQRGQRFGRHYDESNDISPSRRTFFTVLMYLNGSGEEPLSGPQMSRSNAGTQQVGKLPLGGGETNFFLELRDRSPIFSVAPLTGTCLVHEHGERCLLHEGAEVHHGVKYVLRTDIVYEKR